MRTLLQDLRYAARQLRKSPGFTIAAVLTLAIGIGANTAVFSSMDAVVLRPLAVPRMDRVMTVARQNDHGTFDRVPLGDYEDWQRENRSFEDLAVRKEADLTLNGAGDAEHVRTALTSANFFSVLKAQALLGRVYDAGETVAGRDGVVVLNYGFWQTHFGGDPGVLGRKIELDLREFTVIGVMPKAMQYPSQADLFLPLAATPQQLVDRTNRDYFITGRLRDGVTLKQAQAEMATIADRLAKAYPATNLGWSVKVEPLLDGINGEYTPLYYRLIMGATLFVLLVVCANVANLQFARGIARRPEIAMRTALGASRWRLMRQLLTENILLGFIGAAGGVVFGAVYLHMTLITMPARVARYMAGWSNISLNGRALGFSLLLAVLAGVVAGFLPAAQALRVNLVEQLKAGSRNATGGGRTKWLRSVFAVAQISLAIALVIGASLMAKGMQSLLHLADVYEPGKMLTWNVALPAKRYDTAQKQAAFYAASLEKLRALPGVRYAEISGALPYSENAWEDDVAIENRATMPGKFQSSLRLAVSQGYFAAFQIPIVEGRGFTASDGPGTVPVAVVSRKFADVYFPGQSVLGRRIRMGAQRDSKDPWLTIVGIARETRYSTWDPTPKPAVYMNAAQVPQDGTTYAVMTDGDVRALAPAVRKAMAGMDAALPLDMMMTYQQYLHELLTGLMYAAVMLGIDAVIALLLAAIGIFGVMANQVGERTREIGVRLALGARREDVLGMVLGRASWLTAAGVGVGLVMAYGLAHMTANLLVGVRADDPLVFAGITLVVAALAIGSSWIPARRAARIDPMVALRDE
jgi:predicted permease